MKCPQKMKHLFITGHLPSNKTPIAGQKISYNFLDSIKNKSEYIVLCFPNRVEKKYENLDFINSFGKFKGIYAGKKDRLLNHFYGIRYPIKCSGRFSSKRKNLILDLIKSNDINEVTLEFTSVFCFYKSIRRNYPNIKINLIVHDISFQAMMRLSQFFSGLKKMFYYVEMIRLKKLELLIFKTNDVIVLNNKDREILLAEGINDSNISVQPPILDSWLKSVDRNNISKYSILFLGALHRPENYEGLKWFIENVFDKLRRTYPKCKLIIVGKGAPKSLTNFQSDAIQFLGYVKDLKAIFSTAHLAVSPILFGAGIKIKTLEYIASGIPTISTDIGAEGIDSHKLLHIANTQDEFEDSIAAIFNS
jgi:glycosyltransferase involved in cell wall biosynthesis